MPLLVIRAISAPAPHLVPRWHLTWCAKLLDGIERDAQHTFEGGMLILIVHVYAIERDVVLVRLASVHGTSQSISGIGGTTILG